MAICALVITCSMSGEIVFNFPVAKSVSSKNIDPMILCGYFVIAVIMDTPNHVSFKTSTPGVLVTTQEIGPLPFPFKMT